MLGSGWLRESWMGMAGRPFELVLFGLGPGFEPMSVCVCDYIASYPLHITCM